jgi:hypothetical protein
MTAKYNVNHNLLGICAICGREMVRGPSVDWHHFVPRSETRRAKRKKGKPEENSKGEVLPIHKICHRKLHSLFTEKELAAEYHTPQAIAAHPDMQVFIAWVRKQPIEYYDNSRRALRKR